MTGLSDVDIKLDESYQLTQATDGDAPLVYDIECLYQNIVLEALTQEGDVFYAPDFGWSLYDFINAEDDELTRLEIAQRARTKLAQRSVITPDSIGVQVECANDKFLLHCVFMFANDVELRNLDIQIGSVKVEVMTHD